MERKDKEFPRSEPCPCGSGRKYGNCCLTKGIEYVVDKGGKIYRQVPVSPEVIEALEEQKRRFAQEFGREPGPEENLFFDMPPLEHLEAEIAQGMRKAGIDPALIYAFEKTGLIVSEENKDRLTVADLAAWEAAIEEYRRLHGDPWEG